MKRIIWWVGVLTLCAALLHHADAHIKRIYIDPGHHNNTGAWWTYRGEDVIEDEIVLAVGLRLRDLLMDDNRTGITDIHWEVRMSREYSSLLQTRVFKNEKGEIEKFNLDDPLDRAKDANHFKADLFLSIHCNAVGSELKKPPVKTGTETGTGTETFWCDELTNGEVDRQGNLVFEKNEAAAESEKFARLVHKYMVKYGEWRSRRIKADSSYIERYYIKDEEVKQKFFERRFPGYNGHIPMLAHLAVPGCLNEIGFVSHELDANKLLRLFWQERFARAYRDAIYEYFGHLRHIDIILKPGWNMFSIPGIPTNPSPDFLISTHSKISFWIQRWDPIAETSQGVDKFVFGEGYFVHSPNHDELFITYFPRSEYTVSLEQGFNQIGSVSKSVSFSVAVQSEDGKSGAIDRDLWTLSDTGRLVSVPSGRMEVGAGYFIEAFRPVEITVSSDRETPHTPLAPMRTVVLANFPNPFNPETWIPFHLGEAGAVSISIHTTAGHLVRTLDLGHLVPGLYSNKEAAAYWDGRNEHGTKVASGVYFYTLQTQQSLYTGKMLLLK